MNIVTPKVVCVIAIGSESMTEESTTTPTTDWFVVFGFCLLIMGIVALLILRRVIKQSDYENEEQNGTRADLRIISKAIEAQQTDTLSRNNDGIPDIIAHGIMEEVRMQTTQVSTPDEPNYSSDPYYDAECKISEIIAKHRAAIDTLSGLRTQIEKLQQEVESLKMQLADAESAEPKQEQSRA